MTMPSKRLAYRLIGLAEVLLSQGKVDDAYGVARAALRGFVTLAEEHYAPLDGLHVFLSAIEYFASNQCKESSEMRNALIRLYGRLLNLKHAEMHDWDFAEHAILRSCVLHGLSGGPASALADLTRKTKSWKMNPDSSYVVTAGGDKRKLSKLESDTEDEGIFSSTEYQRPPKNSSSRGITEKHIKQRQSATIAEWLASFK